MRRGAYLSFHRRNPYPWFLAKRAIDQEIAIPNGFSLLIIDSRGGCQLARWRKVRSPAIRSPSRRCLPEPSCSGERGHERGEPSAPLGECIRHQRQERGKLVSGNTRSLAAVA